MLKLEKNLLNPSFSHIYVEKNIKMHPNAVKILENFKNSKIIEIDNYKQVFCRSHQNFIIQKESLNLILAYKKENLVYEGAEVCQDFGNEHFYYTSSIMNCVYDCEYCYLKGMYLSANIVIFVNIEDVFTEIERILKDHSVYLCISYDSDILSMEKITGFVSKWFEFASRHSNLKLELRTKSSNYSLVKNISPLRNVILAWTLSPKNIIDSFEHRTSSLANRIKSINQAIADGWFVRICFDPILYVKQWKYQYSELIEEVFSKIDPEKIQDISIGVFRISKSYLKKMQKQDMESSILAYPFQCENGVCTYSKKHIKEMIDFVYYKVSKYIHKSKIYV